MQQALQQRVLGKASELLGGEQPLSRELRVSEHDLALFLSGAEAPTKQVFLAACDILIGQGESEFLEAAAREGMRVIALDKRGASRLSRSQT
jgi:hypothetical protein